MALELLLSVMLVIIVDQLSKQVIIRRFAEGQCSSTSPVRFRRITNGKASQRLVQNRPVLLFLWGLAVLSIALLIHYGSFFQAHVAQLGLSAAVGGASSNLCDILWRRGIIDFIDLRFWPVFNLADIAIVSGVLAALWFAR